MMERRRFERIEAPLEIKVIMPGERHHLAITRDFSDGGAFVIWKSAPSFAGDVIYLQLNSMIMGNEPPRLKARVVRVTDEGVAFQFISN